MKYLNLGNMDLSIVYKISFVIVALPLRELVARECLCVHEGLELPVDQHNEVTKLLGGTCAEVLKHHVHFKNTNWTLVMYNGHHAFVEKIRTEFDIVECDENNVPITTTVPTTTTITMPTPTTTKATTQPPLTTVATQTPITTIPVVTTTVTPGPYCPPKSGQPSNADFTCLNVNFVSRASWGASTQYEVLNDLTRQFSCPLDFVVIHHTLGDVCTTASECIARLQRDIQNWKQRQYNFAIGNDGTIFELNGFSSVAKHANFFDNMSLGVAFIGNFSTLRPSQAALDALGKFLECAVEQQLVSPSYVLRTERDVMGTGHGAALYEEIENMSHY